MINDDNVELALTKHARTEDMEQLRTERTWVERELRLLQSHYTVAETISQLRKESIPPALQRELLSSVPQSQKEKILSFVSEKKPVLLYTAVCIGNILLLNISPLTPVLTNFIVISCAMCIGCYQLLKSRFFVV